MHLRSGIRVSELLAVQMRNEGQVHPPALKGIAEFIGGDGQRAECGWGFEQKNPNPLASSGGMRFLNETSLHSMKNLMCWLRVLCGNILRRVSQDDCNLRLKIHTPTQVPYRNIIKGPRKVSLPP